MAIEDEGIPQRRAQLMGELKKINAGLARLGVPARVPAKLARLYSTDELEVLLVGARQHYLTVQYQMRGTT